MHTSPLFRAFRLASMMALAPVTVFGISAPTPGGPPPNDLCTTAVVQALSVGSSITLTGDNIGATATDDWAVGSPFFGAPVVWHGFTTTQCATITISYCGQAPIWANTFGILANSCPADTLTFPSTFNSTDCPDGNTTFVLDQVAAGTYYLPVLNDPGNNSSGPYSIDVAAAACAAVQAGDLCADVLPEALANGSTIIFSGDNSNATATGDFVVGSPFAGAPVVWHAFTLAACADVSVAYCGLSPTWNNTLGILSSDCPADNLTFLSGTDNTSCGDGNTTYYFDGLAAGTYYLPVLKDALQNAIGAYNIAVAAVDCPTNQGSDFCSQVIPLALANGSSLFFTGDNTNASATADFVLGSPFNGAPVVWHAFTTAECADVSVAYCGQTPSWNNTLGILSTDCPADSVVFLSTSNTIDCGDGNVTYFFNVLAAGTYYLPVLLDPNQNAVGPYGIEVAAEDCPSGQGGDACAGIVPVLLAPTGTYIFTGDNTNATPFNDFAVGNPFNGAPVVWHAFIVDQCEDLTISYCGQNPAWAGQFGILALDCPADSIQFPTTINTSDCPDGNVTYEHLTLPAGTYYMPVVLNALQNSVGPYSIEMATVSCSPLSVQEAGNGTFAIVPNPNNGSFTVGGLQEGQQLVVFDLAGRSVHAQRVTNGTMILDLRGVVASGTYVVRVSGTQASGSQLLLVR